MLQTRLSIIQSDITLQTVDAIVNAANTTLLGGGGVDGAIHRAAGPELLKECRTLDGCATGEAKITEGYRLPAKYVIHTVGPIWHGGNHHEDILLAQCYRNSFQLVRDYRIKTLAIPSISTGVYGFPVERASRIALHEIARELKSNVALKVIVVCFDRHTYDVYEEARKELHLA
ncbi:MAG TPA: O-acetyl-ADP-ribose deacetylase [Bacteroidota bacterium]|nr:O-acetyl-ADP-ribose deacetylase [Bacteroidota bacterium]